MAPSNVQIGYRIPLDKDGGGYKDYIDTTYESFLSLARTIYPSSEVLTDHEDIVQLQNVYFLLRRGIIKVMEEKTQDGIPSLFLEIVIQS